MSPARSKIKHSLPRGSVRVMKKIKEVQVADSRIDDSVIDSRKRDGGELEMVTELPLDILLEIFRHLHPSDLLSISRTTKQLRLFVTMGSGPYLWKQSYKALQNPPPECPSHVNIVHYTNFLFGSHCMVCAASDAQVIHWSSRVRLCRTCSSDQLLIKEDILRAGCEEAYGLCPSLYIYYTRGTPARSNFYYCATKLEYSAHKRALDQCVDQIARLFYRNMIIGRQFANSHQPPQLLQQWAKNAPKARQARIATFIKDAGYAEELEASRYSISNLPHSGSLIELTDQDWPFIRDDILGVFEKIRQEGRIADMARDYQSLLKHLSFLLRRSVEGVQGPMVYAPATYVAQLEPFKKIMTEIGGDLKHTKAKLDSLEGLLPEISKAWKDKADEFFLGLLSAGDEAAKASRLHLASTFFACKCRCIEPMSYPRILMHSCLRSTQTSGYIQLAETAETKTVYGVRTIRPDEIQFQLSSWNDDGTGIWVDEDAVRVARTILRICGQDAERVTAEFMDNQTDIRLECTRCATAPRATSAARRTGRASGTRQFMTWRLAILHDLKEHKNNLESSEKGWSLVTNTSELSQIYALEEGQSYKHPKNCRHCHMSLDYIKDFEGHLREVHHGVGLCRWAHLSQHGYQSLDEPMRRHPYVVKL